jgi:hypothetical protein
MGSTFKQTTEWRAPHVGGMPPCLGTGPDRVRGGKVSARRTGAMATYKVTLINANEGLNQTIDCADDQRHGEPGGSGLPR